MATNTAQGRFRLGADLTFPALPFQLPDAHQDTLKNLARVASLARLDGRAELSPVEVLQATERAGGFGSTGV